MIHKVSVRAPWVEWRIALSERADAEFISLGLTPLSGVENMTMTDQEIYDTCARHLMAMDGPSRAPNGDCMYRGPDGARCAIGVLIDDDVYTHGLEGDGVECSLEVQQALHASGVVSLPIPAPTRCLLTCLQDIHDNFPVPQWAKRLRMLAVDLGLQPLPELRP